MNRIILFFIAASLAAPALAAEQRPLKVFILAGQSNMEGQGIIAADAKRNGGKGSLEFMVKAPAGASRFAKLTDKDGKWRTRAVEAIPVTDVHISPRRYSSVATPTPGVPAASPKTSG